MPRTSDKRENLIRAADTLFHRQGFENSSIADVASAADVPLGNVYYYFKTREELAAAVVGFRKQATLAWLQELDGMESAEERLVRYVGRFESLIESRKAYGCPTGGLCQEANKSGGAVAECAALPFRQSLAWLERQFAELGRKPKEAKSDAARIVGGMQGAILLTSTLKDGDYMAQEIKRIQEWVSGIADMDNGKANGKENGKGTQTKRKRRKT